MPTRTMIRLCEAIWTEPPGGVNTNTPGAIPALGVQAEPSLEEIEAADGDGVTSVRSPASGRCGSPTGSVMMIWLTVQVPTLRGTDATMVIVACIGVCADGLTWTGNGAVVMA